MSTERNGAAPLAREVDLLTALERWAGTLDELADMFRATAGERSAGLGYVYGDVAGGVRTLAAGYRQRIDDESAADESAADHTAA